MRFPAHFAFRLSACAVFAACSILSVYAAEKNSSYHDALESIRAEELGGSVTDLASEAMEGREAGTRGGLAAANYLAEHYQKLRLKGVGDEGTFLQHFVPNFRNVLAFLQGADPELRDQVIVISAHYDHVGYGLHGMSRGPAGYLHPGADDNASGTSAVLELAKAFTVLGAPPKRSILFAHWDAEEKGLLGSKYWASNPTIPIEHVKAMINLDMVGHLRDEHLRVLGSRSGAGWRRMLCGQNGLASLELEFVWGIKPNADYFPFFQHQIPVLMFHTGLHDEYHRPTDTADRINKDGMAKVTRLLFGLVYDMAERESKLPDYRDAAEHETPETEEAILAQSYKPADRFGVIWMEDASSNGGIVVSEINADSPAERAGVQVGDCIVRFAGHPIRTDDDFFGAVASADSPARLTVKRPDEKKPIELKAELPGNPLRWGFVWRVDDAEPGVVILGYVIPGSPAAQAGLRVGDRIYQVAGHDFADETAFAQQVKAYPISLSLLVERDGRLRVIILQNSRAATVKRAA
jgi:hypothetical protein